MLMLALLLVNLKPAWADVMVSPTSPIAGQPFTVSGNSDGTGTVDVKSCSCPCLDGASTVFSTGVNNAYSLTVPGLPAGTYAALSDSENGVSCANFTVVPALIPEYPLGLAVLAVLMVLAYAVIKRRTRNDKT